MTRVTKEKKDAAKAAADLLAQHPWIATEKQYFGAANTAWAFSLDGSDPAKDPRACRKRLADLKAAQEKLVKSVNLKARLAAAAVGVLPGGMACWLAGRALLSPGH